MLPAKRFDTCITRLAFSSHLIRSTRLIWYLAKGGGYLSKASSPFKKEVIGQHQHQWMGPKGVMGAQWRLLVIAKPCRVPKEFCLDLGGPWCLLFLFGSSSLIDAFFENLVSSTQSWRMQCLKVFLFHSWICGCWTDSPRLHAHSLSLSFEISNFKTCPAVHKIFVEVYHVFVSKCTRSCLVHFEIIVVISTLLS